MKSLLLFIAILLAYGCREEEASWDSLSPDEQAYIRQRAQLKCQNEHSAYYTRFKKTSADLLSDTDYNRGKGFLLEYKNDSTLVQSIEFRVWKREADRIYFYVTETDKAENTSSYFLRVKRVQNEEIIDDFFTDQCATTKFYTSVGVGSEGPLVVTYEYPVSITEGSQTYTDVVTFDFNKFAVMGAYQLKRTVVTKDTDDNETGRKVYTTTYSLKTYTSDFATTDYSNTTYFTQKFCEVADMNPYRLTKSQIGFSLGTCPTTLPSDPGDEWDLSI